MPLKISSDRYRREADRCRHRAASATEQNTRNEWMSLAEEYDALAGSAEALAFGGPRPKADRPPPTH